MTNRRPLLVSALLAISSLAALAQTAPVSQQTMKQLSALDTTLLDPTTPACTNFYQYACGGWLKANPIPADHDSYGRSYELMDRNELQLKSILEKAAAGGSERSANEQKIGDDYATCLDTAAIESRGMEPLLTKVDRIHLVFSKSLLPSVLAKLYAAGVEPFFGFGSDIDADDPTLRIAAFDQPSLGLPEKGYYTREDAESKKLRDQYADHIARTFVLAGEAESAAKEDAKTILTFETALAKASLSNEQRRDPHSIFHRTELAKFEQSLPALDIAAFLRDLGITPERPLNIVSPAYFVQLNQLLATTDLSTLKTYIRWVMLRRAPGLDLPAAFDQEAFHFYGQVLSGQPEQLPRWKRCVESVDRQLGEALGQVYVAEHFSPADKQRTLLLATDVEAAMGRDIDQLPWMSDATKAQARQKLHAITNKIGYPDTWRDYSSLSIVRGDAFGNALRVAAFNQHRDLVKINKPVDRTEWYMSPPTVDAYYSAQMNDVNFPAGILQPPFFDPSLDDAVNYGDAGGVIGHELTHAFDDEGRQFDGEGKMRDWWTSEDAKKFNERADCVVKEYDSFVAVPGQPGGASSDDLHVNGKLTLGENLADLGGLRLAYLAYMQRARQQQVDLIKQTDGLTPAQRFFIAYSQGWCGNNRPESLRLHVQTDPHSPEEFRVNGVVRNLPEFQQAFHCEAKQPMVAKDRCSVW